METVVLLGREKVNEEPVYVYIDYVPENGDYLRGLKGNATYTEIKKWIKETYGMSVSSLYVAQIKEKCGFEKRKNYNTGVEGHRVPKLSAGERKSDSGSV